jgi:hypothetical protein
MGHEIFSPGAYVEPLNPGDASLRGGIPGLTYRQDWIEQYNRIGAKHPGEDGKNYLTKEFVDNFDTVIVMHLPRWIVANWPAFKGKRVVWRTIGQSIASVEKQLSIFRHAGLQVVRYSPMERNIPGYIGEDAMIRFYKDPADYNNWNGVNKQVINFTQDMQKRDQACNFSFFEEVTRPFQRRLFGIGSDTLSWGAGKVPFPQLQEEMRNNAVYFYTGTHPASYTLNFMEAWMTGIPVVAIGPQHGNASYFPGHDLYEIPKLIKNGINGFVSDDVRVLQENIKALLDDQSYAKSIGEQGRKYAIQYFGKDTIKAQWAKYLG